VPTLDRKSELLFGLREKKRPFNWGGPFKSKGDGVLFFKSAPMWTNDLPWGRRFGGILLRRWNLAGGPPPPLPPQKIGFAGGRFNLQEKAKIFFGGRFGGKGGQNPCETTGSTVAPLIRRHQFP